MAAANQRNIQWAILANENALLGAYVLAMGGFVGIVGAAVESFPLWFPIGIYACVLSLIVFILEYPRGKKNRGNTVIRTYQIIPEKINMLFYPFAKNYYIRAIIFLIASLPAGLAVPTFAGAFLLLFASLVYFVAAIKGEMWTPVVAKVPGQVMKRQETISAPPSKPPPTLSTSSRQTSPSRAALVENAFYQR